MDLDFGWPVRGSAFYVSQPIGGAISTLIVLTIIQLFAIGAVLFFQAYLKKKGEDLATKENVRDLTDRIESVRHRYSSQLEELKAVIQSQLFIQQVRYKNEFDILFDLSKKTVALRDSALAFRPIADYADPKETPEERKEKRLKAYMEAGKKCYEAYEPAQPFYPLPIYQAVLELDRATFKEAVEYRHGKPVDTKYWDQAEINSKDIVTCTNKLLAAIRTRVQEWESTISKEKP